MLKLVNGRWALVSKKTLRPLAYYKGEGKPSDEWVKKQEQRIEYFKNDLREASYAGNIGVMEIFKFHQKATQEQKKKLQQHINNKKHKEAWDLIQRVSGVKLHPSVYESKNISPDILPVSGAGQDGTDTLVNNYKNATPGQGKKLKTFKQYNK